jgi:hypothetical protein
MSLTMMSMQTSTTTISQRPTSLAPDRSALLRRALRTNAVVSILAGAALAIAPQRWDEVLGTDSPGWIRIVGIAVAVFGVDVAAIAARPTDQLRSLAPAVVAGDAAWVVASVITIAVGWYSTAGTAAVVAMAAIVGTLGAVQYRGWQRIR